MNPELILENIISPDKTFILIQDGHLPGGTKQRGYVPYVKNSDFEEFIYAGPSTGYAQVALAIAAKCADKKATIFVEYSPKNTNLSKKAEFYGATIYRVYIKKFNKFGKSKYIPAPLKDIQNEANKYFLNRIEKKIKATLIPFGGDNLEIRKILQTEIGKAFPLNFNPKRLWLVAGSGILLQILSNLLPNTFFEVVQVGKKIWPDQLPYNRYHLHISPERFFNPSLIKPPYNSVITYDAKLWQFVIKYGQDGDYIWNVAQD